MMTPRKSTVLLVEDDEMVARAVMRALAKHCEVVHAGSLSVALPRIAAGGFSAMICDWDLGDGKGAAALILCANLHPAATRIVYSGRSYDEIAKELPADVLQVFVQKPEVPGAIIRALGFRG